jgi:hypothetical protein
MFYTGIYTCVHIHSPTASLRTKLSRAELQILDSLRTSKARAFSHSQLAALLYKERGRGALARHTTFDDFVSFLIDRGHLVPITLRSAQYKQQITRYCFGSPSAFELASSIRPSGYLSHSAACRFHGLIDADSQPMYVNVEQSIKPASSASLTQTAIDRAFASKQRESKLSFTNKDTTVTILSGKNTGRLGVEERQDPVFGPVKVTNIERTLLDISVRPAYGGGIARILEAYRSARTRVSVPTITSLLETIGLIYPYAQAIGFMMERAGFAAEQCALLRPLISEFRFYLAHEMKNPAYDETWRIYHPRNL